jgi:hypothetical protein
MCAILYSAHGRKPPHLKMHALCNKGLSIVLASHIKQRKCYLTKEMFIFKNMKMFIKEIGIDIVTLLASTNVSTSTDVTESMLARK